jgi:hypothetical protein
MEKSEGRGMTIRSKNQYHVTCDAQGCQEETGAIGISPWSAHQCAVKVLGWTTTGEEHLCPKCSKGLGPIAEERPMGRPEDGTGSAS